MQLNEEKWEMRMEKEGGTMNIAEVRGDRIMASLIIGLMLAVAFILCKILEIIVADYYSISHL